MTQHDGEITTPIPRSNLRATADRVRVRRAVEADTGAIKAAPHLSVDSLGAGRQVLKSTPGKRTSLSIKRGTVVDGTYRIVDRLARGGTAIVYRAWHITMAREVALKVLTPPTGRGGDFEARFIREAKTLAALAHPNVVEVIDFGRMIDGRCYLAMEFLDGPRLSDYFRDSNIDVEARLDALIQVAHGIQHAHARGVIHRDIKLSNAIVVRRSNRMLVKVLDFGLAKLAECDEEITQHGVTMGSPHFMSPEQARGHELDGRTDIYSMGILTWIAFTGEYPYAGSTATATMVQHCVDPIPWLSKLDTRHPVPEGLCDTVRKCMAKDRDLRFDDMKSLIVALETARHRARGSQFEAIGAPPEEVTPEPANKPIRRPSYMRLALLGWLLVTSACLLWQEQGAAPPPWTVEFQDRMERRSDH